MRRGCMYEKGVHVMKEHIRRLAWHAIVATG